MCGVENLSAQPAASSCLQLGKAYGYLLHGFLPNRTKRRTDEHWNSPENRGRFLREITGQGRTRIGVKIAPEAILMFIPALTLRHSERGCIISLIFPGGNLCREPCRARWPSRCFKARPS